MPQSLVKILLHVVFSTKNRVDLIHPEIEAGLYAYIHGIVENNKSKLIIGNGTANHGHLLISMGKTIDVSVLVGDIKRDSSVWMKQHERSFYWQEGYGAFSIIVRLLRRQEKYPQTIDNSISMSDPKLPYSHSDIDGRTFYHGTKAELRSARRRIFGTQTVGSIISIKQEIIPVIERTQFESVERDTVYNRVERVAT